MMGLIFEKDFKSQTIDPKNLKIRKIVKIRLPTPKIPSNTKGITRGLLGINTGILTVLCPFTIQ